jgi:hypothetical protein
LANWRTEKILALLEFADAPPSETILLELSPKELDWNSQGCGYGLLHCGPLRSMVWVAARFRHGLVHVQPMARLAVVQIIVIFHFMMSGLALCGELSLFMSINIF